MNTEDDDLTSNYKLIYIEWESTGPEEDAYDELLDQMDELWLAMTEDERRKINRWIGK